ASAAWADPPMAGAAEARATDRARDRTAQRARDPPTATRVRVATSRAGSHVETRTQVRTRPSQGGDPPERDSCACLDLQSGLARRDTHTSRNAAQPGRRLARERAASDGAGRGPLRSPGGPGPRPGPVRSGSGV